MNGNLITITVPDASGRAETFKVPADAIPQIKSMLRMFDKMERPVESTRPLKPGESLICG